MTTKKLQCGYCYGNGLIEANDTMETCRHCDGSGWTEIEIPDTMYPKLQAKIDAAIAAGNDTVFVWADDIAPMRSAGYTMVESQSVSGHPLGAKMVAFYVAKPTPEPESEPEPAVPQVETVNASDENVDVLTGSIDLLINTSDDAMTGSDGWGNAAPAASVSEFIRLVRDAIRQEYPGFSVSITETDYTQRADVQVDDDDEDAAYCKQQDIAEGVMEIVSDVFGDQEWYVDDEAKIQLNAVTTPAEIAATWGVKEDTVRDAAQHGWIAARKSGSTWLIRRADAEARWGKQGQ